MQGAPSNILRVFFGIILLAAAALFFVSLGELVRIIILASLGAYLLDPFASFLEARGLRRNAATSVIFVGLALVVGGGTGLLAPAIVAEVKGLQSGAGEAEAQTIILRLQEVLRTDFAFLGAGNIDLVKIVADAKARVGDAIVNFLLTDIVSFITHLVAIPFMIFFFLRDGRDIKKLAISMVPNRYFEFSLNLLYRMDRHLGNFLRGQALDALAFGTLATIALWILDVKYFFLVGAFAGLANLIPYVGPIAGTLVAVVVVLVDTNDFSRVLEVMVAFAITKLIDDAVIQPLTIARSVHMHPVVVLLAVIVGGHFFGILGMLLAVPVAGFLGISYKEGSILMRNYRVTQQKLMRQSITPA